ncbi:MAG: hypothetical protein HYU65_03350 [Armatimonadetes bacterium]|nr:hypothetical protein [Armatimonadota bacterium]
MWGGRNDVPLWKQNELFWDDDVTPAGVGGRYAVSVGTATLTFNAGTFSAPDGGIRFHGNVHTGQVVYAGRGGRFTYTAAGGVLRHDGSPEFKNLRNGNGGRDYTIWIGNVQTGTNAGGRRLTLGFDGARNSEDYSGSADAFAVANLDEKNAFVVSANWGATGRRYDWQIGYYYARIETLAVNASFAQDDWERWGSATQNDSSNFKGHEVRFTFLPLNNRTTVMARLYVTDAVTSIQESRRFRVDLNTGF